VASSKFASLAQFSKNPSYKSKTSVVETKNGEEVSCRPVQIVAALSICAKKAKKVAAHVRNSACSIRPAREVATVGGEPYVSIITPNKI
jgi:hypothetical protein